MRLSTLLLAGALLMPMAAWADPLQIVQFSWRQNWIPNSHVLNVVQGRLVVRNASSRSVPDVTMLVHLRTRKGREVDVEKKVVGTLRPGEQQSFDWQWRDDNSLTVTPVAQILHASGARMVSLVAHPIGGSSAPAVLNKTPAYTQTSTGPTLRTYNTVPNAQATAPGSGASGKTPTP